jgi:hypothetical protein
MPTLLIVGYGRLGSAVLDQLATRFPNWRIVVLSRGSKDDRLRLNLTRYNLLQWGLAPRIDYVKVNLSDVDRISEVIAEYAPSVVFNATTPFPWWRIAELPSNLSTLADSAGPGMWAALDVVLPALLSRAIANSGQNPIHVNGCYPDLTNAFLANSAGAPLTGIGNISNLIPGFRLAFASEWGVDVDTLAVRFVGHHYTSLNGPSTDDVTPAPYLLFVESAQRREEFVGPSAAPFSLLRRHALRSRGEEGQAVTVGSAATVLAAFMSRTTSSHHCPGPLGLPGGYPVTITSTGSIELNLAPEWTSEQAVEINREAQKFDGTSHLEPGRAIPTEEAMEAQKQILGFTVPEVLSTNFQDCAIAVLEALKVRHGIELGAL